MGFGGILPEYGILEEIENSHLILRKKYLLFYKIRNFRILIVLNSEFLNSIENYIFHKVKQTNIFQPVNFSNL